MIFILLALRTFLFAQDPYEYVKEHAIRIESPLHLNDSVFDFISPFKLIMIGEMHGTIESAQFVYGLAQLLAAKGDSVQVGFEIPSQYMSEFLRQQTDSSVFKSEFFMRPPFKDGRQSVAWAETIAALAKIKRVSVFFFDINDGDGKIEDRDRVMYQKVKNRIITHPGYKTITLSGNYHNITESEMPVMGYYLKHDKELQYSDSICSLNIYYLSGSMINNSGDGLKEKTVNNAESVLSKAVNWPYYIMPANPARNYDYTGILFCRKITSSKMVSDQ